MLYKIARILFGTFCISLINACDNAPYQNIPSDQYIYSKPTQLVDGLTTATPTELALNQADYDDMVKGVLDNKYGLIDSVLIFKNDKLILEEYFNGFDQNTPHDLRSATKRFYFI